MSEGSSTPVVRGCRDEDVPALMAFLGEHWRSDHVLSRSRALMDWQHQGETGDYAYRIAVDAEGIAGAIGYILASRFDPALAAEDVLWVALWVVRADLRGTALGLRLLDDLRRNVPHRSIGVNGINPDHPVMYRALGFTAVTLVQHVALHPSMSPHLTSFPAGAHLPRLQPGLTVAREVDSVSIAQASVTPEAGPAKSVTYFRHRFLDHPFYRYRVHELCRDGAHALMATRVAEHDGHRALRIVDYAGPAAVLSEAGTVLEELLIESQAEYVDLIEHGLPAETFDAMGMMAVDPDGPIMVPNFFEPFLARTARPLCVYRTPEEVFRVFRADGDQDRPNQLPT